MLGIRIFNIWKNYLISQFLLMVIIGVATYFSLKIIGIPYALGLSILAGVCEGIPQIGPVIAAAGAVLIAYIKGSSVLHAPNWQLALIVLAITLLIQWAENWLIKPKLVSSMLDIHPVIALIGMTFFGILFGVPGLLLSIPLSLTIREIFYHFFYQELSSNQPSPKIAKEQADQTEDVK